MNLLALLLLFVAANAYAQGTLEVISLRHRTAEQVIPVLRPLLEPGGVLTGQYNQLIVRTSPGNLAQISAVLDSIDQPARRLTISVRFDTAQGDERSGVQTDARISNRGSNADIRILDSRGRLDEHVEQRLQVLEGGQAYISTGESRNYAQADTGFAVVPRISGSNVFLEIGTRQEAFARGGAIQGQRAATTVSGRLGEWIELGGADSASTRSDSGILSSRERSESESRRVWVKVEELR
ncbi:MAG: secretin N-terminal domain-containing protein [Betaproteobacteria bacterium]